MKLLLERAREIQADPTKEAYAGWVDYLASQIEEKQECENALTDQLKALFALAEAYPELKANRNFLDLAERLSDIEDQLQMARRYYNGAVRNYNIRVESFPSNVIAKLFSFVRAEFFQIESATERAAPKVEIT